MHQVLKYYVLVLMQVRKIVEHLLHQTYLILFKALEMIHTIHYKVQEYIVGYQVHLHREHGLGQVVRTQQLLGQQ